MILSDAEKENNVRQGFPHPQNSANKLPSPKPKCTAAARALFGSSKRRRIDRFYRKQFNLVESFEQDSRQIQVLFEK